MKIVNGPKGASMAPPTKILLTGATGYIGGSVLTQLLRSNDETIENSQLSVLIRGAAKAKAFSKAGINPILFNSLDDSEVIEKAASEHDIVVHTASGSHADSAVALIKGLGKRKANSCREPHYIHTSGASNLADQPITGKYTEKRDFSDKSDDIYAYLKYREAGVAYSQRATDIAVIEAGRSVGVKTHIIMPPAVYGVGIGNVGNPNILTYQVPTLIRAAIEVGQAEVLGDGRGTYGSVHIVDLCSLYEAFVAKAIKNEPLRDGKRGIYFSATGRFTWKELSQGVADAGFRLGAIDTSKVKSIGIEEAAEKWTDGSTLSVELMFAGNSRTNSDLAKELGWKPEKTKEDFKRHYFEEFKLIYEGD